MLSLFLLLLSIDGFCQSEQDRDSILQFKNQSSIELSNSFATLEFAISNTPDCEAITRQVHAFLFDQYPVPGSCYKAKKLEQQYSNALASWEEQCLQQRHSLESVLIDSEECENSPAIVNSEESISIEDSQAYLNCKEEDHNCIDLCDVYSNLYLHAIMKSGSIAQALRSSLESNINVACMADRNSNCVDALAAISKKMPVYINDSEELKSCFTPEPRRAIASLGEEKDSLFARVHRKISGVVAEGKL